MIDAHLHLYDRARLSYPWMTGVRGLPERSVGPACPAADGAHGGAVVIEAGVAEPQRSDELDWLGGLAAERPWMRGVVAAVSLPDRDRLEAMLGRARTVEPGALRLVGVRDNFEALPAGALAPAAGLPANAPATARLEGLLAVLEAGLTFDACVRAEQWPDLTALLRAVCEARGSAAGIVLDHAGKPQRGRPSAQWRAAMTDLAQLPGLAVKLSGLPGQCEGTVSAVEAQALAQAHTGHLVADFGAERVMFGSDHPVSTTAHGLSCEDWAGAVQRALEPLGAEASQLVLGGTASRFYGLD